MNAPLIVSIAALGIACIGPISSLFQYHDNRKGKIKAFVSIPWDKKQLIKDKSKPNRYVQIKLVNVTDKVRLISDLTFYYDGLICNFGLYKDLSFPVTLSPMDPFELLIPIKLFFDTKQTFRGNDKEVSSEIEDVLKIIVSDTTGKRYYSKFIIYNDGRRILSVSSSKGPTSSVLKYRFSLYIDSIQGFFKPYFPVAYDNPDGEHEPTHLR